MYEVRKIGCVALSRKMGAESKDRLEPRRKGSFTSSFECDNVEVIVIISEEAGAADSVTSPSFV